MLGPFRSQGVFAHQKPSQHYTIRPVTWQLAKPLDHRALGMTAAIRTESVLVGVLVQLGQPTLASTAAV